MKPPVPIRPGVAFLPLGVPGDKTHLWIVVSPAVEGRVLAVNITDEENYPDSPCVLRIGDHEYITKNSAVNYPLAREFDEFKLGSELAKNSIMLHMNDLRADVLLRITEGARVSEDMTFALKQKFSLNTPPAV